MRRATSIFLATTLLMACTGGESISNQHSAYTSPLNLSTNEGQVRFYADAKSDFDRWTKAPSQSQQKWFRQHYQRMLVYEPYFDKRLAWYPNGWVYRDAYAIKKHWPVFTEQPDWVLRDVQGQRLYIPFDCSNGSCPQYAADIGNPDFRRWWLQGAQEVLKRGYLGLWVDDVNLTWRVSNGNGQSVTPIDPRTNKKMTLAAYQDYFALFMEEIRARFPDTEIIHNLIWFATNTDNPAWQRQVQAADYLNLERGVSDPGITGGIGKFSFTRLLGVIDAIHALGRAVVLDDDDDANQSTAWRDYELAFYFLINSGRDFIGADGARARMAPGQFWFGYQVQLGPALGSRYQQALPNSASTLYRRDFACGMVLVNPPESAPATLKLEPQYRHLDGSTARKIRLEPATGRVFTKPCS